jgi:hypothetical protein
MAFNDHFEQSEPTVTTPDAIEKMEKKGPGTYPCWAAYARNTAALCENCGRAGLAVLGADLAGLGTGG